MNSFPISKVNSLRRRASKARAMPDDIPDGWFKSVVDPMNLLNVFKSLRIRPGFTPRAYQYQGGGNGNGFIWAMPTDAPFLKPDECPKLKGYFLEPPKPPEALDNFMEAIEGNGTPWSYLSASIFAREASEFGALWHGCSWSDQTILGENPFSTAVSGRRKNYVDDPARWTWLQPQPESWEPMVEEVDGKVRVSFFVHDIVGRETIYRAIDTYSPPSMKLDCKRIVLAEGEGGIVY